MPTEDQLCQAIGIKIRNVREQVSPKLSQVKLAAAIGVSRVSVVNIEGGRQHAPVHLLWRIAEQLNVELVDIIPRNEEFLVSAGEPLLDDKTIEQIRQAADNDPVARQQLTDFIGRIKLKAK